MAAHPRRAFVGRQVLLEDLARAAVRGETRIVTGPPGIGRTSLLAQVADLVRPERPVHDLIATTPSAALPLGVFLPLLDRVESTFRAATRLRLALGESRPLLIVDDAHLLDAASTTLLLELARDGVPLLLSLPEGRSVDHAVAAVVRDGDSGPLVIPPLTDAELARLVKARLVAIPDPALVALVQRWSDGIPLFVDEILDGLVAARRIGEVSGTAYLVGDTAPPRTGCIHVDRQVSPQALRVARLVALAQSLPVTTTRGLATTDAVEEAEVAGLIGVHTVGGATVLAPRHPWIAESLIAELPTSVRWELIRRLVDAHPNPPADPVLAARVLTWRDDLGGGASARELLEGARRVRRVSTAAANGLLERAMKRATLPDDRLAVAGMLASHQHRVGDAEALLAELASLDSVDDDVRRRRDTVHAFVLLFPGNDPTRARDLLQPHADDDALVRAHLATAALQLADISAAIRLGTDVVEDEGAPAIARAHAALTLSAALVHAGRMNEYDGLRHARSRLLTAAGDDLPEGIESARLVDGSALIEVREALDAAQSLAHASYERSLAHEDDGMRGQYSHQLARIWLERGLPSAALPLAIGAVVADGLWALAFRAWTTATLIETLALAGRRDEAAQQLELESSRPRSPLYDIDIARAAAVLEAVGGDVPGAADRLADAGSRALSTGQLTRGRHALDQAVRYGSDAAARALLRVRGQPGAGALSRSQAIARAWLVRDGAALDACAGELASRGLVWRATEVASAAWRVTGGAQSPTLTALRARCPSLGSPVVPDAPRTVLTAREAELASRAAAGRTDAEIAADTGLSIRTVQTHLSNVYHKLGIRSRADLDTRLRAEGDVRSRTAT